MTKAYFILSTIIEMFRMKDLKFRVVYQLSTFFHLENETNDQLR